MRKFMCTLALGAFFALAPSLVSSPSFAQSGATIQLAPPASMVETIPPSPGGGVVWTPGFYRFDQTTQSYVWQPGSYQVPPALHMEWIPSQYIRRPDGSYVFFQGHFATHRQARKDLDAELRMER